MIINTHASTPGAPSEAAWYKSSYSNDTGGACIEVAVAALVHVRDSKQNGGHEQQILRVRAAAWTAFVQTVRS